jgi:hypothetical protein
MGFFGNSGGVMSRKGFSPEDPVFLTFIVTVTFGRPFFEIRTVDGTI